MKKYFWSIAFVLVLAILFAGCQTETKLKETIAPIENSGIEDSAIEDETQLPSAEEDDISSDVGIQTDHVIDSYLTIFEEQLEARGYTLDDKVVKDAVSIGALVGYGFNIKGKPIEIYLFDRESSDPKTIENLTTAQDSGFVTIFGVEINGETPKENCMISGDLVLLFPMENMFGSHPEKEGIVQAFMSIH